MQNITFTINMGVNNLEYTKLLLQSLQKNLDNKHHQIVVFIDADNENSLEYLLSIKPEFHDLMIINNTLPIPVGYQRNKTILTEYAKYDIVSYLQSDMVVGPHYDTEILKDVKRGRILSSTRVEPPLHGESPVTITKNFGLHPSEFSLEKWNEFSNTVKREQLINYFFAPMTYYKQDWLALDGYDTVFRRAREDSDLVQRCLHAGIELVQTFNANVYHFTCVTSRGERWFNQQNSAAQERVKLQQQADNIELRRFIRKWGNFNHGAEKLHKLDIDLVVKNYDLSTVEQIEPFFSRVWVSNNNDKDMLLQRYDNYHSIANTLLHSTNESWLSVKDLFHVEDFDTVFMVGEPTNFEIKVEIDFNKITSFNLFLNNLQNLYHMLLEYEAGKYELDGIYIEINHIKLLPTHIRANNPPFNNALLEVY